jgi:predicted nuclease with TOPRIM domain
MDATDRAEIRQMLTDVLAGHTSEINGRYNVIHSNLIQIKEQTTKTNGRVTALEDKLEKLEKTEIQHIINCPNTGRISVLETAEISRKSVFRFVSIVAVVAASTAGIVIAIIELVKK